MDSGATKGKPLSKDETKGLLAIIENSKIINNKTTNATNNTNNKLKNDEWKRISDTFNATVATTRRTPQQLRLKWENMKKNSRKRSTKIRINNIKTKGEEPEYIPPDEILDRVSSILEGTVNGFTVEFGTIKADDGRRARDLAIAKYYTTKQKILDVKIDNILLQNKKLQLEIEKLESSRQ